MNRVSGFITWIKAIFFKTRVRGIITLLVLFIIGYFTWSRFLKPKPTPQYQTATVTKGTLITTVSGSGNVSAGNTFAITTQATGVITNVYVKNGDTVTQGEKIADITLDQPSQQRQQAAWANYLAAQNSVNSAQANLNQLQSALFKANQAFVTDAGTPNPDTADPKYIEENADWLQAQANYKNQTNVIAQAQASLSNSWLAYQQVSATITAPANGVITDLTINQGLPITSSTNATGSNTNASTQTVGTITIQGGQLEAIVSLSEIDVPKVKPGQPATMTLDAYPNKTFTGKVASVNTSGSISSNVTNYPATIIFDTNDGSIYTNMSVDAKIITDIKNDVLLVPSVAIQTQGGQSTVRKLINGKPQIVDVTTGESNDTETEITSGLSQGDTIIEGSLVPSTGSGATSSPFSGTGFGGLRGFGGGGFGGGGARGGGAR